MSEPRKVVITGVSRGLGRAMTDELIRLGHHVAGCGRSPDAVRELSAQYATPHSFACVDVGDEDQVRAWADRILIEFGPPDLILNTAALINASAVLWEVPAAEFSRLIDINIKGPFHIMRHFLPAMIERSRGVVVNFSSGWGRGTSPKVGPYCASKWAIEGLTKALASELPKGLAAVPLNPGVIRTEMLESCLGAVSRMYPKPADWARRAAPFVLSLGAEHNGESVTVPS